MRSPANPPRPLNRAKPPAAFRLLAGALSVLLSLGLLELGLRLFWLKTLAIDAGEAHPRFHHRLKPDHTYQYATDEFDVSITTNRYGFRGPTPERRKRPGTVRVLFLGDSFTFGYPVRDEETFAARIEQGLRAQGRPVEIINGGVSGYSPVLEYLTLRDELLAFGPDLVVLWYDLGDLQDDYTHEKNLLFDQAGRILAANPRYRNGRFDWWGWCAARTALGQYLDVKVLGLFRKISALGLAGYLRAKRSGRRTALAVGAEKRARRSGELLADERFLLVREGVTEQELAAYWPVSARYLLMIRDLLAGRGIPLMLGIYPYGMLIGEDEWAEGREYWGFERGKVYDASRALAHFARFSAAERIPLINTYAAFRAAAGAGEPLFYSKDGHMTPAGHRVLAESALRDPQLLALLDALLNRFPPHR
jgi:hypothetical protein